MPVRSPSTSRTDNTGVTWSDMTNYVAGQLAPINEARADHDAWHLAQATAQNRLARTNMFNIVACLIAFAGSAGAIITEIAIRK